MHLSRSEVNLKLGSNPGLPWVLANSPGNRAPYPSRTYRAAGNRLTTGGARG